MDTDFPLFRLADVYLMYAECVVRLHNDWDNWAGGSDAADPDVIASRKQGAIFGLNQLRERSHASDVWASNFANDDEFLQFILDERARELYHEGYRRTDLIRYDRSLLISTSGSGRVVSTMDRQWIASTTSIQFLTPSLPQIQIFITTTINRIKE